MLEEGFKAIRFRFHHENVRDDIRVVEAVRKAVGEKTEIMVDANQGWKMPWNVSRSWDLKMALSAAREMERLGVYWLEEPLPHHQFESMAKLHLAVGLSECPYVEFPYDPPSWSIQRSDYVQAKKLAVDGDGYVHVPDVPGLGIVLDEEALSRYQVNHVYVGEAPSAK